MEMTFSEYKQKISIIDLLVHLGYKFDKSKGKSRPNFVLQDEKGNDIDRVIITNPDTPANQGYWRRDGSKGDLITFVRENLKSFGITGRNEIDCINKVLSKFSNELHKEFNLQEYLAKNEIRRQESFNPDRYVGFSIKCQEHVADFLFQPRGITRETVAAFSEHIFLVYDTEARLKFKNIGFPYTQPGSDEIEGFEFRGQAGFKGKAAGTNSQTALWIADFSNGKSHPSDIQYIFFAESALDILSLYQLNKNKIDLPQSVFASIGGSFSERQITGMLNYYPNAFAVDCFDNDEAGLLYGRRMAKLAGEKFRSLKAPATYKDWNDALMKKPL